MIILDSLCDSLQVTVEAPETETSISDLEQLQDIVNRYCLSLTGSRWDAEDLAQDTWLKAAGTLQERGHINTEAFLLRVAKNLWIDKSRRKTVLTRILNREQPKVTPQDEGPFELETVFQALRKHLSPLQRTVFLLRDVFGYSSIETADMLDTTEGAVKAALHRARSSLDTVRDDLAGNVLPLPAEEEVRVLLSMHAAAYQSGDIAKLIKLTQHEERVMDVAEPVMMRNSYSSLRSRTTAALRLTDYHAAGRLDLRMAA